MEGICRRDWIALVASWMGILGCKLGSTFAKNLGGKEVKGMESIFELAIAPATKQNPRNSESAIVQLKDGSLLLGWTEFYAGEPYDHSPARLVGRISSDGGKSWGEKFTLVENHGKCNVMEVNFLRLKSGEIALFYCEKNTPTTDCRIVMRTSKDEGKTWGEPKYLSPEARYIGLTNGRSLMLSTGRILLEAFEVIKWQPITTTESFCLISDDDGKTWWESQRIRIEDKELDEPVCVELKDGRVMMLMRTNMGAQFVSISEDGGESWSEPKPTELVGPSAPAFVTRIPTTGNLLAIWNHNPKDHLRNPLTAAISRDEGKTWFNFRNIENVADDQFAYPAVTWFDDKAFLTYFNYKGGLSLKLRVIPASWFER